MKVQTVSKKLKAFHNIKAASDSPAEPEVPENGTDTMPDEIPKQEDIRQEVSEPTIEQQDLPKGELPDDQAEHSPLALGLPSWNVEPPYTPVRRKSRI